MADVIDLRVGLPLLAASGSGERPRPPGSSASIAQFLEGSILSSLYLKNSCT